MLVWSLQAMGFLFNISQRASVSYDRIETLLAEIPDIQDPSQPVTVIQNGDLEYNIKEFAYEKEPVLEKLAFHLEKGQTLGLWGQLDLERLPCCVSCLESMTWSREISCSMESLSKDYRLEDLRSLIGYVPQDQILFAMTIQENVAFQIHRSRRRGDKGSENLWSL